MTAERTAEEAPGLAGHLVRTFIRSHLSLLILLTLAVVPLGCLLLGQTMAACRRDSRD